MHSKLDTINQPNVVTAAHDPVVVEPSMRLLLSTPESLPGFVMVEEMA